MYTDTVMDHFTNPRNVGEVEDPDGVGEIGNPVCGDVMRLTIRVDDDRITDARFKTFGCGAAVATSSMVTELVQGKTLDEALELSNKAVAEALGGLPPQKMHCSNLAADALHLAVEDYRERRRAVPANAGDGAGEKAGPGSGGAGKRREDAPEEVSGGAAGMCTLAADREPPATPAGTSGSRTGRD